MSALPGSPEGTATTGLDSSPVEPAGADLPPLTEQTRLEAREIMTRYPSPRSALLPMLHLVQSAEGRVTAEGIEACAEILGLTAAEVSGVATFYTMYKRRPTGRHLVSVCTNTLCAVLGGQRIFDALSADLGLGQPELLGAQRDALGRDVALVALHQVQHRQQRGPGARVAGHDLPRLEPGLLGQRRQVRTRGLDGARVEPRRRRPLRGSGKCTHLSTPPMTGSIDAIAAMTSAIMPPSLIAAVACSCLLYTS